MIRRIQSKGGSGKKRRVVFDMSDDENEDEMFGSENVISLASPEPPKQDLVLKLNLRLFKTQVHLRKTKILREGKIHDRGTFFHFSRRVELAFTSVNPDQTSINEIWNLA